MTTPARRTCSRPDPQSRPTRSRTHAALTRTVAVLKDAMPRLQLGRHLSPRRRRARARAFPRQAIAAHSHSSRPRHLRRGRDREGRRSSSTTSTPIRGTWRAASRRSRRSSCRSWTAHAVLGEIDIDSDRLAAFGAADRELLEAVAALLAPRLVTQQRSVPEATMAHVITLIPGRRHRPRSHRGGRPHLQGRGGWTIEWERHDAGAIAFKRFGQSLPAALLDSIRRNKVALKGPVTTPIGEGFTSVNVGLRKALDLYANLRPVKNLPGIASRFTGRRPDHRPREHRGPLRRPRARGRARRGGEPEDHHREGVDAHRALRVRVRARARAASR